MVIAHAVSGWPLNSFIVIYEACELIYDPSNELSIQY